MKRALTSPYFRAVAKRTTLLFLVAFFAANFSGCFIYNRLYAKDRLNHGARRYNAGKYDEASAAFKEAFELDPNLVQARLFYATSLRSQVLPNSDDPKNVQTARDAIAAYKELIEGGISSKVSDKDKDQAYAFISDLYRKLGDEDSQKKWLESRAKLPNQDPNVVAECYYAISVTYWEAAHKVSDRYIMPGIMPPKYKPVAEWDQKDKDKVVQFVTEGLRYNDLAIGANAKYANAYSYKNLFYREQIKIEADPKKVSELTKMADDATETFQRLNREAAAAQGG